MTPRERTRERPRDKPREKPPRERVKERPRERPEGEERQRHPRLDTPRELRRSLLRRPSVDQDTFGIFAERFARFMGTARFLLYMTVFVIVWVTLNLVGIYGFKWDKYPFILLNLFFSTQASYAAPLILLAQNRQEDRDRVVAEQDRQANTRAHADMEFLAREVASLRMAMGEVATRDYLRSELRALLADLEDRQQPEDAAEADREADRAVDRAHGARTEAGRRDERHVPPNPATDA